MADQILQMLNFVFSHDGHFGLGGLGGHRPCPKENQAQADAPRRGTPGSPSLANTPNGNARDALEGKGPQGRPQRWLGRRLEEVAEAVGGGYCRLQMPLKLVLGVRGTVAGRRLGALEGGSSPPVPVHPWVGHGQR